LTANCIEGVSQNFASPSGCATWTWIRVSSREKKNNRNWPSRTIVGAICGLYRNGAFLLPKDTGSGVVLRAAMVEFETKVGRCAVSG
jgi:hypothetical protein